MAGAVRLGLLSAVLTLVLGIGAGSSAAGASGSPQPARVGVAPEIPSSAQSIAPLPGTRQLQLTIALKSQDPAGLASLAEAVSSPSSPLFRHYIGVDEFAQRFGATPASVAAVRSALQAQGLSVGAPTANELTLPVRGTAKQVGRAFSTSLSQIELAGGRIAYANSQAPSLPAAVVPFVQSVVGLDSLLRDQPQEIDARSQAASHDPRPSNAPRPPHARRSNSNTAPSAAQLATGGPQPCLAAEEKQEPIEFAAGEFAAGVTADQVANAYQLSSLYGAGDFGAGQTIAVFEQEAFQPGDIAAYQACYGTSATVTTVDVDGGPEPYEGEDGEAALDIEQIIGLAPRARVAVYQGPIEQNVAPVDIISRIVSDDTAKVISSSWGICESVTEELGPGVIDAENTLLQEAAAQGQSFYVASGDSGSEQCSQFDSSDHTLSVLNPASQPFATGVGGTSLYSTSEGGDFFYTGELPPSEGVWNDGPHSGTGGGVSQRWAMPSYQSAAAAGLGVINANSSGVQCGAGSGFCRQVPDVSADADPNTGYVVFVNGGQPHGGWTFIGGTSAAAPLWAAVTGLANASPACRGVPVGFANPSLYAVAASQYASDFKDVTEPSPFSGAANNNALFGTGLYPVTLGYDMTTGLGSPVGPTLASSLCSLVAPRQAEAEALPQRLPPSAPAPVQPTPVSPGTVSSTPSITQAQITAGLLAQLAAPSGKGAKLAALLKADGYSFKFKALEAGTLVIEWFELPRGAKLAKKPKPVLVASGRMTFSAANTATVKVTLTGAGKRLLAHARGALSLTGRSTFTPRDKAPARTKHAFQLKR
jgi:subtilase family serine protease